MRKGVVLVFVVFFGAQMAPPAAMLRAQVLYGSIVGKISDPSGAAIVGAKITISEKSTNLSRQTTSNAVGNYDFPNVLPGTYDVTAAAPGFTTLVTPSVPVTINNITRVDLSLQLGAVTETVTVGAQAVTLQTDRAEVRAEVTSSELVNLPVPPGRNFQQLLKTLPGIAQPATVNSPPTNPSRALAFNVNGTSYSSNDTRIDGVSAMNPNVPHNAAYIPPLEAIEAVNVVTNSFDAETGLAGGTAVNVQIKSGTNDIHGSTYEYHTNQHLKAKPFFLPIGQSKPKLIYNQGGGTIGGPIRRNKLFYFAALEGTFDRRAASLFGTVPTAAMKAGDMSSSDRPIYDPLTGDQNGAGRTVFAGNMVPASRVSPIARKLADLTPLPNLNLLSNNYYAAGPFIFDRYTGDGKINWNPSPKLSAFLRMSVLRYNSYDRQIFDALGGPPTLSGSNPGDGDGGTYSTTAAVTYVVSPTFVIDAYYGYTRADTSSQQRRLNEKLGLDFLGIPGTNGPRLFEGGWPRFSVSGFTNIGINEEYMPYYRRDPSYHYVANFNWTHGPHDIRFGFDINPRDVNQAQAQFVGTAPDGSTFQGAQGGFVFAGGLTSVRGGPTPNQYNSYAAFLLGEASRLGKTLQVPDEYGLRMHLYSFYVRDRWAATPKLTIDYGLRWEYFPLMGRADRGLERYDPATDKMLICGIGVVPHDCAVSVSKRMFAPRVGLAYRATKGTVLRAGYGITNDPFQAPELLRGNYPGLVPLDINGPNSFIPAGTLQQGIPPISAPNLGNGIIDIGKNVPVNSVLKDLGRGYIQSWNFTIEKELRYNFTGQMGYVATRQVRQFGYLDINAGQVIGAGQAGQPLLQEFGRTASVTMLTPLGSGHYDSLQATLDRRFSHGLQIGAHYTFSKAIGMLNNNDSTPSVSAIQYFSRNRTVRGFDRTQNLQVTNIWELPFGKGRQWANQNRVASALLGGWQINNIWSFMSGLPFTVTSSGTSLDLPGSTQTADQVKPTASKLGGAGRGQSFFDPLAFAPVTQARFGAAGFNSLRGPGIVNLDFGLFREFAVTERWKVQFRAEAFNFTNTPHFANPGGNVSNMVRNNDGSIRDLGGYTEITNTYSPAREGIDERQIRFGLRVSW